MRVKSFLLSALMIGSVGTVSVSADLLGDVNDDGVLNVRDCAMIARKLAEDKADELFPETADYNGDGIINVRDATLIAHDLNLNFTQSHKADKGKYDTKSIAVLFQGRISI